MTKTTHQQAVDALTVKMGYSLQQAEKFVGELGSESVQLVSAVADLPYAHVLIQSALDLGALKNQIAAEKSPEPRKELEDSLKRLTGEFETAKKHATQLAAEIEADKKKAERVPIPPTFTPAAPTEGT